MIQPYWLALVYGSLEIAVSLFMRSKSDSSATDKGSLRMLWRVIGISVTASIFATVYFRFAYFGNSTIYWIGFAAFVCGLAWRWYAILYLGRFFTVDVTVAADQVVIDTGPYRLIRHPSYAGGLLAFLGLGLCYGNYLALIVMVVPITAAFLYRIRIEEAALQAKLAEPYRRYMSRTRRLIPYIY